MTRPGPDWFTGGYAEATFARHLGGFAGQPDLRFLQIGAYCGDASEWLLNNVVTHPSSVLFDVDTWEGSLEPDHEEIDFQSVHQFYTERMEPYSNVSWWVTSSDGFFAATNERFDFIYIDGSHQAHQVLRDAVNADAHLRAGGILAFDDYRWGSHLRDTPAPAIDAFLRCFEGRYELLDLGLQVWVRKQ